MCGLVNAPKAWFDRIQKEQLQLGSRALDLDPCIYILPGDDRGTNGIIGIHVHDLLGGGNPAFAQALESLRGKLKFASEEKRGFNSHGCRIQRSPNGNIQEDMDHYLGKLEEAEIPKSWRDQLETALLPGEFGAVRGVLGALFSGLQFTADSPSPTMWPSSRAASTGPASRTYKRQTRLSARHEP